MAATLPAIAAALCLCLAAVPLRAGERLGTPPLLTMPPGWAEGDPIALLLPPEAAAGDLPDALRDAFLATGVAVLAWREATADAAPRPDLTEALRTAHGIRGAGLVIVIAPDSDAAPTKAPEGLRIAARLPLGAFGAATVFATPPAVEAWPVRAPLLCAVIEDTRHPGAPAVGAACRAALTAEVGSARR
jgi:hypothetical protein